MVAPPHWVKSLESVWKTAVGEGAALAYFRAGRRSTALTRLSKAQSVLLVRPDNRVGEALLMTPLINALAGRFQVDLWLHEKTQRVLDGVPGVRAHFSKAHSQGFSPHAYDVVVNCANWATYSGTAALLSRRLASTAVLVGPAFGPGARLMDVPVAALADTEDEVLQRLHLLSPLGIEGKRYPLSFRTPRVEGALAALAGDLRQARWAVLNPGGRLSERRIPASVFVAVGKALSSQGLRSLVTWGPGEEALAREVVSGIPGATMAPATNLDELAGLMQASGLVVCNNTGPMHLSVAVGAQTLAFFRNMPMKRWGHAVSPHAMVDLTSCGDDEVAMAAQAVEASLSLQRTKT